MNLMRIGNKVLNLDRVESIAYEARGGRDGGPTLAIDYDVQGTSDPVRLHGDDARAAWRAIRALCEHGEADEAGAGPSAYRILDPDGRRGDPRGDVLAVAGDLGELRDAAERISQGAGQRPGSYPIADGDRPWGDLRIDGPGRWEVRSHDATVTVLPGAYIL